MTSSITGISADEAMQPAAPSECRAGLSTPTQAVIALAVLVAVVFGVPRLLFTHCPETYPYLHSPRNYVWSEPTWQYAPIRAERLRWEGCKGDVQPKHAKGQTR